MRYCGIPVLFAAVILLSLSQAFALDDALAVTDIAITSRIARGNPVDSVQRISCSAVKELYCFTKIRARDDAERQIVHVWYRNNEVVARYSLPVRGTSWRTYSKKTLASGMAGNWRVEVLDADGNLLKSRRFRLN